MSHPVHIQTHKTTYKLTNQTKLNSIININGFDLAKSAAQLLYGPVLVLNYIVRSAQRLAVSPCVGNSLVTS